MPKQDEVLEKLNAILETLKRMEERQVKTTAMVQQVEESKIPVVGSFATAEIPGDEKKEDK